MSGYDGFNELVRSSNASISGYYTNGGTRESNPEEFPTSPSAKESGDIKKGRNSIFNRYYLFHLGNGYSTPGDYLDSSLNGNDMAGDKDWQNPSFTKIIEKTTTGQRSDEYSLEDFLYCANAGKIPNNHMITLRRFGSPIGDNLTDEPTYKYGPDIGRLVGFIDGEANKWESFLGFSVGYNWKDLEAKEETVDASNQRKDPLIPGKIKRLFDTSGRTQEENYRIGTGTIDFDPVGSYPNRVWGKLDVITKQKVKGKGLEFKQDLKVVFEYELKSINGVNPRVAMMDLLANVLSITYSRGEFWGGNVRFIGAKRPTPLGGKKGAEALARGDFAGYASAVGNDVAKEVDQLTGGKGLSLDGIVNAVKTVGKNLLSGLGGLLASAGKPDSIKATSLISGENTGEWHLTIGNPLRPAVVMGNLVCTGADIEFTGPLGFDDFPSIMRVTCSLDHARPRDKDDIESMFNAGNGRMYGSVLDFQNKVYYQNYNYNGSKPSGTTNMESVAVKLAERGQGTGRFNGWSNEVAERKRKWSIH